MNGRKPDLLMLGNYSLWQGRYGTPSADLADRLEQRGYRVLRSSCRQGRIASLFDRILTAIRRRREYDVALVDVFSGPAFLWAEWACWALRRVRKPYVLTLHGGNLPAFGRRHPRRVRHLLQNAVTVTAPSRYLVEQMRPYRDDILLIPNAVDVDRYEFRLRRSPKTELVWLRAFDETYNPSLAPKVIAQLTGEFPKVRLTMFGPDKKDGSLRRCRETAEKLGVTDRISFAGAVPKEQISRHLNTGDVFLNTTRFDNTPVSVIEAAACGLCIVTTDVGGIPYLLQDGQNALLVPPDDPDAMTAAVRRVLIEPGLAERLSEGGLALARSFRWDVVLPLWETIIHRSAFGRGHV